jgi:hypothetical protein
VLGIGGWIQHIRRSVDPLDLQLAASAFINSDGSPARLVRQDSDSGDRPVWRARGRHGPEPSLGPWAVGCCDHPWVGLMFPKDALRTHRYPSRSRAR